MPSLVYYIWWKNPSELKRVRKRTGMLVLYCSSVKSLGLQSESLAIPSLSMILIKGHGASGQFVVSFSAGARS